ncbi:MAG: hypothetical protein JWM80_5090 [Cyanobacteria bacterium RYN_339]|nr:hypothetical protein [Cyanobacteria bacterium RYN_339]
MTQATATASDREIVQERIIDAPRALVYKAWTDPAHLPVWFGPKGFSCTTQAIDLRVGGHWTFTMHGPDGKDWPNHMAFAVMEAPSRLEFQHGAAPGEGFQVVVTFEDLGVRTRLRQVITFPSAEECAAVKGFGAVELGQQTLDKLAERVATMGLRITRTFDAPRERVYQAWADPERFAQWWTPKGFSVEVKQAEIRPGGVLHYCQRNDQMEMWGRIEYVELVAPERIVFKNSFSNPDGGIARAPFSADFPLQIYNVLTFAEQDGKTVLEMGGGPLEATEAERAFFAGMNASMQAGFKGTFDGLAAYLAEGDA